MLFLLNYNFLVSYIIMSVNDYFCDLRCYSDWDSGNLGSYDGKYRERLSGVARGGAFGA